MMQVLILGGGRYYIKAVQAAKELGARVIVADRNPEAPARHVADLFAPVDITDRPGILDLAKREKINGIVALNDFAVPTAAHVAEALNLPGISPEAAANATSKFAMRELWQQQGVPSPLYRITWTHDEAMAAARGIGWPVVLKPSWSLGGASRGVSIVEDETDFDRAWDFAFSFSHGQGVLVEECLIGSEHSAETLTWDGETHVIAIGDKVKTPPPYRVDKSVIYPTRLMKADWDNACETVRAAVRAIGIDRGAAHVEFCFTREGAKLFELGARCGGGGTPDPIVPYVAGVDMFKEVVRLACGLAPEKVTGRTPDQARGCTYHFLTPKPGILKKVLGVDRVKGMNGILDCDVFVSPNDTIPPVCIGTERAGFIIAGGVDRASALSLAIFAEKQIIFKYQERSCATEMIG